jgi:hypothetical protein
MEDIMKRLTFPAPVPAEQLPPVQPAVHKSFCFAGQPAPCPGYFENDVLPCVCGATQDVLSALAQVQVPATPVAETARSDRAPRRRALRQRRRRRGFGIELRQLPYQEPGTREPAIWKQAG